MHKMVCPDCKCGLKIELSGYSCSRCSKEFPEKNGIVCFAETNEYYGELSQNDMQEFLALCEKKGWANAVSTYLPEKNPGLIRTITDSGRISWCSVLNLKSHETVLDYGCGLGTVSMQLADQQEHVVAMDGCFDRIRFLQIKRDQEGLKNISLVCNGQVDKLPFDDSSFDLVVLNMVFPYLAWPLREKGMSVEEADLIVMGEISRILKPEGQIYLSMRNKYYHGVLWRLLVPGSKGKEDPTFLRQGHSYYEQLFLKSGMGVTKSFWPIPDYKAPTSMVQLDGGVNQVNDQISRIAGLSTWKKSFLLNAVRCGAKWLLPETVVYVSSKKPKQS